MILIWTQLNKSDNHPIQLYGCFDKIKITVTSKNNIEDSKLQ